MLLKWNLKMLRDVEGNRSTRRKTLTEGKNQQQTDMANWREVNSLPIVPSLLPITSHIP